MIQRAFMSLFGQDVDTFTRTMLLNVDQLQKQLDKDEFQEDGSMTAFWVVNNQLKSVIDFKVLHGLYSQMTDTYFVEYTGIEVQHFRDTLLQHLGNVKKSVAERTRHQRQYERRVNKRQMQTQESKIDTDIRPIYDEEPMAEVQLTAGCNIFAIGQQHTEQPEIINEGRVDQYPETCQVKSPMLDSSPDNQTTEYSKQSLESENILLKETVAQFQKDFSRMEAHCIALELKYQNQSLKSGQHGQILNETKQTTSLLANNAELKAQIQEKVFAIAALKNDLRKLKGNSVDTKFDKTSVLGKPVLPSLRNQSVVKQPNAFKSERAQMSKTRFCSQRRCEIRIDKTEVNSRAKIQSHKTRNSNKPVDQKSHTQKPGRQIFIGHRFSPNKTSAVYEKTSPRSDLRWKPTGRIFKSVGLRWIPTGKLFDSCTSKVDSEPPHGSNVDIPNIHECKQTLDSMAAEKADISETIVKVDSQMMIQKNDVLSTEVHQAAETVTTSNELDLLFGPLFDEYFNGENQVVLKSSAVTTTDASNKRQQQPDSTSSTSTLATTVTANGNFDLSYALSWKPCQGDSLNLPDHRAQVDQGSQIKMIQVKEMMQDNDLKNSKSKDKGSKSRSQSMDEQSHYKQDKTITRQSINVKRHIFNVIGGTEEFEERDLNIGGDC
ncbi:hypothetical protein Tco_0363773 [Tanacetum coccineum]